MTYPEFTLRDGEKVLINPNQIQCVHRNLAPDRPTTNPAPGKTIISLTGQEGSFVVVREEYEQVKYAILNSLQR